MIIIDGKFAVCAISIAVLGTLGFVDLLRGTDGTFLGSVVAGVVTISCLLFNHLSTTQKSA